MLNNVLMYERHVSILIFVLRLSFIDSDMHGRLFERRRLRSARDVRVRRGVRGRAMRARRGRVQRRARAVRRPRRLPQHARLVRVRMRRRIPRRAHRRPVDLYRLVRRLVNLHYTTREVGPDRDRLLSFFGPKYILLQTSINFDKHFVVEF